MYPCLKHANGKLLDTAGKCVFHCWKVPEKNAGKNNNYRTAAAGTDVGLFCKTHNLLPFFYIIIPFNISCYALFYSFIIQLDRI
jgi:hypothetical protein